MVCGPCHAVWGVLQLSLGRQQEAQFKELFPCGLLGSRLHQLSNGLCWVSIFESWHISAPCSLLGFRCPFLL